MTKNKLILGLGTTLVPLVGATVVSCSSSQGGVYAEKEFAVNSNQDIGQVMWNWINEQTQKFMQESLHGGPVANFYRKIEINVLEGEIIDQTYNKQYTAGNSFVFMYNDLQGSVNYYSDCISKTKSKIKAILTFAR